MFVEGINECILANTLHTNVYVCILVNTMHTNVYECILVNTIYTKLKIINIITAVSSF